MSRQPLAALGANLLALSIAAPAGAAPMPLTVTVERASKTPSTYLSEAGRPGTTRDMGDLIVANPTRRAVTVRLGRVNALTADTLGSAYGRTAATPRPVTRWTVLPRTLLRLDPGEHVRVPVKVRVPAAAKPGDYLSGVSISAPHEKPSTTLNKGVMIGQEYRYAVGVETRIPGPRSPRLTLTGAELIRQPAAPIVLVRARNTGNVTLKRVRGSVLVTDGDRRVARQEIGPGTFVSATAIAFPVRLAAEKPKAGKAYRVRARMVYAGEATTLDTTIRFPASAAKVQERYVPDAPASEAHKPLWWLFAGFGVLLSVLLAWLLRRSRIPGPSVTARQIDHALADVSPDAPLSVICVRPIASQREARRIAHALRPLLPGTGRVGRLDDCRVLIILPSTGAPLANALLTEIARALTTTEPHAHRDATSATVLSPTDRGALLALLEDDDVHDGVSQDFRAVA